MTFKTKAVTLISILAALIALYIIGNVFSREQRRERKESLPLVIFEKNSAASIVITGSEKINLLKSGEDWKIIIDEAEYPADSQKISAFLTKLLELKEYRFVTDDPESYERFNLGDNGNKIEIFDSKKEKLAAVFIGKSAAQSSGDYVRKEGFDTVFMTDESINFYVQRGTEYWSLLRIFNEGEITKENVSKIEINKDMVSRFVIYKHFEEEKSAWKIESGTNAVNEDKIFTLINTLKNIQGERFINKSSIYDDQISEGYSTLSVLTDQNKTYSLKAGILEDDKYYLQCSHIPFVYEISEWQYTRLFPDIEELEIIKEEN